MRPLLLGILAFLAFPVAAQANLTVSFDTSNGQVSIFEFSSPGANNLSVSLSGGTITVHDSLVPVETADLDCNGGGTNTVTCSGMSPTPSTAVSLGEGDDVATFSGISAGHYGGSPSGSVNGGNGADQITGSALGDVLQGGPNNDIINGGDGSDQLYGDDGNDQLDGQAAGDSYEGGNGADTVVDTGVGNDTFSYHNEITDSAGVEVTLDGVANDGNVNQDGGADNIGSSIENVQGSIYGDDLEGGPGNDYLSGDDGDDRLVGNGGADTFNGSMGNDRIEARDGVADTDIDCDNQSDPRPGYVPGTADVAILDAADPAPRGCDTIDRPAASGGSQNQGPPTSTTPQQPSTPQQQSPIQVLDSSDSTAETGKMPNIVGKKLDPARAAVLNVAAGIDINIIFQKGCPESQDLEVTRQRPAKGSTIKSFAGSDVPVRMYVCVADREFLKDCDYSSLSEDLKRLPKSGDAQLVMPILDKFNNCKVDYDIKLAKKRDEEAKIQAEKLADFLKQQKIDSDKAIAQARKDKIGAIKATLTCPNDVTSADLWIKLGNGYLNSRTTFFGLHEAGGPRGWEIPSSQSGEATSYVDAYVEGRQGAANGAVIYPDAEAVGIHTGPIGDLGTRQEYQTDNHGYARMLFSPKKPGVIKLCAFLDTGADTGLYGSGVVGVGPNLKGQETWPTIDGRVVKWSGGEAVKVSGRRGPVAHAANVFDVFVSWIKNMFGGLSKASNSRYTPGILCVDGQVHHDPPPLVEAQGSMLINREPGKVELAVGPVLTAPTGCGQIALSSNGDALTAYLPGGNDIVQTTGALKAGTGGLIGLDGGTLIGLDGSSLIGLDGSSLVAAGGGNVLSHNGGAFIAALGAGIAPVPSKMVAAGAGNMVAAGAGNMVAAGAGN